jgi:hypothetical protein
MRTPSSFELGPRLELERPFDDVAPTHPRGGADLADQQCREHVGLYAGLLELAVLLRVHALPQGVASRARGGPPSI